MICLPVSGVVYLIFHYAKRCVPYHRLAKSREERINPTPTATPPQSGQWVGTFEENGESWTTKYMLTFEYDGRVRGKGSDKDGDFRVAGFYNATTGELSWGEKAITGKLYLRVDVTGRFDQDSWQSIDGCYTANTGKSDAMTIRFQKAVAALAPKTKPPTAVSVTTPIAPSALTAVTVVQMEPMTTDQEAATSGGSDTTASS